jgi:co-chaperonin GroES (HSP10)
MELKSLDITPAPGGVLIEYFDKNRTIKYGGLELHAPVQKHDFGNLKDHTATSNVMQHSEREGVVRAVCKTIRDRRDYDFKTQVAVAGGDKVWFGAHPFKHSQGFTYQGRTLALMDYRTLLMRERDGESYMLNGYVLAERVERESPSKIIASPFKEFYPNIFRVVKTGQPVEYKLSAYKDIDDLEEGDLVLTRFTDYPLLEEKEHRSYSDRSLYIIQTRDIFAKVEL